MDDVQRLLTLGGILTSGVGTAFMIWRYCIKTMRDTITDQAQRIIALTTERDLEHRVNGQLNVDLIECESERGALRATVAQHGIQWDPSHWGGYRQPEEVILDDRPTRRPRGGRLRRPDPRP